MKSLREFLVRNRHLVALTVGVSTLLFTTFTVLAICVLQVPIKEKSVEPTTIRPLQTTAEETELETTTGPEEIIGVEETETTEIETLPANQLPYLIMVNRAMCCVTIYEKDETGQFTVPVKAFACSVGREGHSTPTGTYNTSDLFRWAVMADSTHAQYVYRFKGPYLFHSVPYFSSAKDTLETEEYNKLGSPASLGCVRLCVADAIWIYQNCPANTTVIIYDDESTPGPLGKPESIKIPLDSPYSGWDPTDPDEANPWHNFSAAIKAKNDNITIVKGASVDTILSQFKATDTCGNDISSKMTIEGNYNLNITGKYTVTIKVTDAIGSSATTTATISVISEETNIVPETTTETNTETTTETNTETTTETNTPVPETTTTDNATNSDTAASPSDAATSED